MKTALITGIKGQDGSYLAEFLLGKGYKVYGLDRRSSSQNMERITHIIDKIELLDGDLTDQTSLNKAIEVSQPDEVYNLAAQSFVATSWKQAELTSNVNGVGVTRMLEAIRNENKNIRFYQASSSEMFGKVREVPQNEYTRFYPRSPYGVAKTYGHYITVNYRESYDMFAVSGILFNHESPRRGIEFVTKKITNGVAKIYLGLEKELLLGNLDSTRDWGFAGDYVKAMWMMLQQDKPEDYVIATGETHSIKEFACEAFKLLGLNWKDYVKQDPRFIRPVDVDCLKGDYTKAKEQLGWKPEMNFEQLIKIMVEYDIKRLK